MRIYADPDLDPKDWLHLLCKDIGGQKEIIRGASLLKLTAKSIFRSF